MLVIQEVSRVKGSSAPDFASATQKLWEHLRPYDASPGWFFEVSHGTGPSYMVWSGLRLADWSAWEAVSRAMAYGDLTPVVEELDRCRYDSQSTLLEVVSETENSPTDVPSVWVARISKATQEAPASSGPQLVMRALLGGDGPGATTILRREPAADVIERFLDRSSARPGATAPMHTWVLRPTPWSPLR